MKNPFFSFEFTSKPTHNRPREIFFSTTIKNKKTLKHVKAIQQNNQLFK